VQPSIQESAARAAFYDFDGTLVTGNVVSRYAWLARRHPSTAVATWRFAKAVAGIPLWLSLDAVSRRLFNVVFFRQYRGLTEEWLRSQGQALLELEIKRQQFQFAKERIALDKTAGYHTILVTGGLDFAIGPAAAYFGFDAILANRLVFEDGVATGRVAPPLLAGLEKVKAIQAFADHRGFDLGVSRAYSDSFSDLPMLQAVGEPIATNPDTRLRKTALEKNWAVLDLACSLHPIPGSQG